MEEPYEGLEGYLDCAGQVRVFRVREQLWPVGQALEAEELVDGEPVGFRLVERFKAGDVPPFSALRTRIRERLSQRDVVRHAKDGSLEVLARRIRGQVVSEVEDGAMGLSVDGACYSSEELGRVLQLYEGWGIRIEICDAGEE